MVYFDYKFKSDEKDKAEYDEACQKLRTKVQGKQKVYNISKYSTLCLFVFTYILFVITYIYLYFYIIVLEDVQVEMCKILLQNDDSSSQV